MGNYERFSREQLEGMNELLLDMCMDFCGAQYMEGILRTIGFRDAELKALGFDFDDEWAEMEPCMEV